MKTTRTQFEQGLKQATQSLNEAQKALATACVLAEIGKTESAFIVAFDLAYEVERLALLTRVLPAYTGHPQAMEFSEQMIMDTVPIKIGFTREGWFAVFLPALLRKKGKGNADYIRLMLYPAMRRFFQAQFPIRYMDCVLILRHVYDRARPERRYRDHDNIEINTVADIIALYVMKDDSPLCCSHYYCSAAGSEDRTEVYVVPRIAFGEWLAAEKSFPDEGVKLIATRRKPA